MIAALQAARALRACGAASTWGAIVRAAPFSSSSGGHNDDEDYLRPFVPAHLRALPPALVAAYEAQALERFNQTVEGALGTEQTPLGEKGVKPAHVPPTTS